MLIGLRTSVGVMMKAKQKEGDMEKSNLVSHWRKQLEDVFTQALNGQPDIKKQYRAEGFLHALRLAGVLDDEEANRLIENIHLSVFGESVAARQQRKSSFKDLKNDDPDAYFDIPAIERRGG